MLNQIKALILGEEQDAEDAETGKESLHLAEAALMFHVIAADGKIIESELTQMKKSLTERYNLSSAEYEELLEAAQDAEREAIDLYRFTSLLNRNFDRDERIAMVGRLWDMVFADGEMHEFEDNVVWRVAQLLHVESPDRIAEKQRAREEAAMEQKRS